MAGQAELEILLKARDQASKVLTGVGKAGSKAGQAISQNWKAASVALAGAGLALEGLARAQAESTKTVERMAIQLGLTNEVVRQMALDLSNVTFPLEDVVGLMELGIQTGIKSQAALADYANFWDTIGDATGLSATELGKAGIALKAVGIAAGEEQKAIAAFGFIMDNTTINVREFLQFIDKTGPELRAMGLDINDTAAFLAAMEKELGLTGRTARTEFKEALEQNVGDLKAAMVQIGLTTEQVAKYRAQVELSSDVIARNAKIHEASFTPIQRMQTALKDLAFEHAGAIKAAANFAPILIAAGPAAKIAQLGFQGMKLGMGLLRTAFALTRAAALTTWAAMTGPVGLAVIAIVAAVAGILAAFVIFRDKLADVFEFVGKAVSEWVNFFVEGMNLVIDAINVIPGVTIKAVKEVNFQWRGAGEAVGRFAQTAIEKLDAVKDAVLGMIPGVGAAADEVQVLAQRLDEAAVAAANLRVELAEFVPVMREVESVMFGMTTGALQGWIDAWNGIILTFEQVAIGFRGLVSVAVDATQTIIFKIGEAADATSTWIQGMEVLNDQFEAADLTWDHLAGNIKKAGETLNEFFPPMPLGGITQTRDEQLQNIIGGPIMNAKERVMFSIANTLRTRNEGLIANSMALLIKLFPQFTRLITDLLGPGRTGATGMPEFVTGGVVGGPIGRPMAAIVHGGETIIPVGGRAGGGKIEITIHVHGTGGAAFESEVSQSIRNLVRKGAFDGLLNTA